MVDDRPGRLLGGVGNWEQPCGLCARHGGEWNDPQPEDDLSGRRRWAAIIARAAGEKSGAGRWRMEAALAHIPRREIGAREHRGGIDAGIPDYRVGDDESGGGAAELFPESGRGIATGLPAARSGVDGDDAGRGAGAERAGGCVSPLLAQGGDRVRERPDQLLCGRGAGQRMANLSAENGGKHRRSRRERAAGMAQGSGSDHRVSA